MRTTFFAAVLWSASIFSPHGKCWMKRFASCLCTALLFSNLANAEPTRIQTLLSADFADQANAALSQGDRDAAIELALRGLPPEPTATDMAGFPDAARVLYRAVSSFDVVLDRTQPQTITVNRAGDRAVVSPAGGVGMMGETEIDDHILVDPRDDTQIAVLLTGDATHGDASTLPYGASVSPDGTLFGLYALHGDNKVYLFNADDGTIAQTLSGLEGSAGAAPLGYHLGFSPDGRYFAAVEKDLLLAWNIETGDISFRAQTIGPNGFSLPAGWQSDNSILLVSFSNELSVAAVSSEGRAEMATIPDVREQPLYTYVSPFSDHAVFLTSAGYIFVDLQAGQVLVEAPWSWGEVAFVRDGQAVAFWNPQLADEAARVFALDGRALTPVPQDYVIFDQSVHSATGDLIGMTDAFNQAFAFNGGDAPVGVPLYQGVWAGLDPALRDSIDADRVPRE